MEQHANELLGTYTRLYYGRSGSDDNDDESPDKEDMVVSSAYFDTLHDEGILSFRATFLIGKTLPSMEFWSSKHFFKVQAATTDEAAVSFHLDSLVSCCLLPDNDDNDNDQGEGAASKDAADNNKTTTISGTLTKQSSSSIPKRRTPGKIIVTVTPQQYVATMGQMLERAEEELRSSLQSNYLPQSIQLVDDLYNPTGDARRPGGIGMSMGRPLPPVPPEGAAKLKPWQRRGAGAGAGADHAMMLQQAVIARAAATAKKNQS
jgi:hypothetical protein